MTNKKYRFIIERPIYRKCYEQIAVEADSDKEALELCKNEDIWDGSDIEDSYDIDSFGEPEIVERHEL